jgi:hypothetical protein
MAGKKGMHKKWLNDPEIRERVIAKIQNAGIAEMLVKYVKTGEGMDNQRAAIALGLLKKVVPDLASTEISDKREGWIDVMKRLADAPAPQQKGEPEEVNRTEGQQLTH